MGADSKHKNDTWMKMKVAMVVDNICRFEDLPLAFNKRAGYANRRLADKFLSAKSHIQKVIHDCQSKTATAGQSSSIYIPFRAKRYIYAEYEVRHYSKHIALCITNNYIVQV
jgi:uncharacterized protein (DUF885 family)